MYLVCVCVCARQWQRLSELFFPFKELYLRVKVARNFTFVKGVMTAV